MALDIIARGMAADSIKCVSQDLTEEQKAIARNNIGVSGGSEDLKNAVQVIPQNFTEAQKQQARDNINAVSISSFDTAEADIVDLFAETAALGQKIPSASQGSFVINEMTRSNSLSLDPATGGYFFNVRRPSDGVSEASGEWSVSNEITFKKGTISTPGEYTFMDSLQGAGYLKLTPGKSYVMYIKYIRGTIPANLENWAFTFSSGGKTVSMNLNNSLPVEVFVPVAGELAFGGRFTPNGVADPSITFDEVNQYTVQILMVEVNNGSNQGSIIHKNDLATIEDQIGDMAGWADVVGSKLDSLEANTVQVNAQTFTEDQKTQARTNIGAITTADLSKWLETDISDITDLNVLADKEKGSVIVATYGPAQTENKPSDWGSIISFRAKDAGLTQLAAEITGNNIANRLWFRQAPANEYGIWRELDAIAQKGDNYIAYTSGLKIQWGEANVPSEITAGTVITPTIRLPIAMATTSYKILGSCSRSDINIGYGDRDASSFVLGLRNLGTSAVTTSSTYTWVVIGY